MLGKDASSKGKTIQVQASQVELKYLLSQCHAYLMSYINVTSYCMSCHNICQESKTKDEPVEDFK